MYYMQRRCNPLTENTISALGFQVRFHIFFSFVQWERITLERQNESGYRVFAQWEYTFFYYIF